MRMAAAFVFAALSVIPAAAAGSVDDLFRAFGLFGQWAVDCNQPATLANPHVSITMANEGHVLEVQDIGSKFAINRYSVLSADRISATRYSVTAIFQAGNEKEERQRLVYLVRDSTRRTIFNQPDDGAVRVRDGMALASGIKTPLLRKCE